MYCPKCGGQNSDDLAYCRHCGENLKVISQVMQGHAPIAIASKLDSLIERPNERFRRDSIWWGICGTIATVWTLFSGSLILSSQIRWLEILSAFVIPVLCFSLSGWNLLKYRRSLDLSATSLEPSASLNEVAEDVFCPSCGKRNLVGQGYCSGCGFGLTFGPIGLAKYIPDFVIRRLDRGIAKSKDIVSRYQSGWRIITVSIAMLVMAIIQAISGSYGLMALYLFISTSTFFVSGWDYLLARRISKPETDAAEAADPSPWRELLRFLGEPSTRSKLAIALLLIIFFAVAAVAVNSNAMLLGLWILIFAILAAFTFNFFEYRARNDRKHLEGMFESTTHELPPDDVRPAIGPTDERQHPIPLSVTEATTEPLVTDYTRDTERSATTRTLDKKEI